MIKVRGSVLYKGRVPPGKPIPGGEGDRELRDFGKLLLLTLLDGSGARDA